MFRCWPDVASGQAAGVLPRSEMNARRRIGSNPCRTKDPSSVSRILPDFLQVRPCPLAAYEECPVLALNGHGERLGVYPLSGETRPSTDGAPMSINDSNRTSVDGDVLQDE